jgi:hypothetical protein
MPGRLDGRVVLVTGGGPESAGQQRSASLVKAPG